MRVTFVTPQAGKTGGIRVIADYASRLARRGHSVTLISEAADQPTIRDQARSILRRGRFVSSHAETGSHFDGLGLEHRAIQHHGPLTDSEVPDADVLVVTWYARAEAVRGLSASKGQKVYLLQHDDRCIVGPPFAHLFPRIVETWRQPWHLISVSRWIADRVRATVPDAEITVIPNGIDLARFTSPARARQPEMTVGTMYSTTPFKATEIALRAFERARSRLGGQLRLVAFGVGKPSDSLPLPSGTTYIENPPQGDIPGIYASCDQWLFTSREEGFGLPVLEAMACGTPVIATRTGAAEELCQSGGGRLVEVDDVESVSEAIVESAAWSNERWNAASAAALVTAHANSLDDAAERLESELFRIAQKSNRGSEAECLTK